MTTKEETTNAIIWLGDASADPIDNEAVIEGGDVRVEIERTDKDEVAIHATIPGDRNALVSLYLSRAEAALVAARITEAATRSL